MFPKVHGDPEIFTRKDFSASKELNFSFKAGKYNEK